MDGSRLSAAEFQQAAKSQLRSLQTCLGLLPDSLKLFAKFLSWPLKD